MKKRILLLLPALLAAAVSVPRLAAHDGLTVSSVADCLNNNPCLNKIRIGAEVSYGITATLQIGYIDGVDQHGAPILENPITVAIAKSEPVWSYALRSLQLVPSSTTGLTFQAYTIDPPRPSYAVNVQVMQGTQPLTSFQITPDSPTHLDTTSAHRVLAKLAGDEDPPAAPPDFSSYVLFDWQDKSLQHHFLLVPRAMLPATTNANVASSIASQLQSLYTKDQALLASGQNTAYLVDGMRVFRGAPLPGSNNLTLAVMNPAVTHSSVTLEMDNAQVGVVTNEAVGWIKTAAAPAFTMSQGGTLDVQVENVGSTQTDYIVTVNGCSTPIVAPLPAQAQTLNPKDIRDFYFDLATSINAAGTYSCWVTLNAPTGRQYDNVQVFFNTLAGSQW